MPRTRSLARSIPITVTRQPANVPEEYNAILEKEFERKERSKKWDQVLKKTEKKKSSGDGWNYGMIIGNSKYDCAGLSNLPSIKDDRKLIVDRLGNQETYNIDFTFSEHTTQVDDYTNVEDIIEQVEEFMEQVEAEVTEGEGGEEKQTHF